MLKKSIISLLVLLISFEIFACSVPVFRYALEKWEPSEYKLVALLPGKATVKDNELLEYINKCIAGDTANSNIYVTVVTVTEQADEKTAYLRNLAKDKQLPALIVFFPQAQYGSFSKTKMQPLFIPFNKNEIDALLFSPFRTDLAKELSKDSSSVWVLLESGNADADKKALKLLEVELKKAENIIQLPEPDAADYKKGKPAPTKAKFTIKRLSKNDPKETFLVKSLILPAGVEKEQGPVVFPVFGRGRVLAPIFGEILEPNTLFDAADFLCGPCSCQVKEENPGMDLLISASWEKMIDVTISDTEEPPPFTTMFSGKENKKTTAKIISPLTREKTPVTPEKIINLSLAVFISLLVIIAASGLGLFLSKKKTSPVKQPVKSRKKRKKK